MRKKTYDPLTPARLMACSDRDNSLSFSYYADMLSPLVFIEEPAVPTAAIDQWSRVYYNPVFMERALLPLRVGVVVHEGLHNLVRHGARALRLGASGSKWNICADLEINSGYKIQRLLVSQPDLIRPVLAKQYNWSDGKLAEWYWNNFPKDEGDKGDERGGGGGGGHRVAARPFPIEGGGDIDGPGSGVDGKPQPWEKGPPDQDGNPPGIYPDEMESIARAVAEKITNSRKARGEVPAGILRRMEDLLEPPQADWRALLKQQARDACAWVRGSIRNSYYQPNLKQTSVRGGLILPGKVSPQPEVAIVVDTSGSMGRDDLKRCSSEIQGIFGNLGRRPATVLSVDARVGNTQRVRRVEDLVYKGGGGTDMRVGIEAAINGPNVIRRPNIVVVLTDGYTPWPDQPYPGVKVIAVLINNTSDTSPDWMPSVEVTA